MLGTDGILGTVSLGVLLGALVFSAFVLLRFRRGLRFLNPLRKRFVLGIPWGTCIVVLSVFGVYYLVQGGGKPGGPIVSGFRSWSFWYPEGLFFSSFAHANKSHIVGNMFGTVAFAPLAEYALSHYPQNRGSQSFSSWRTNPFVRIALFVLGVFLVGLLGALFVPGAVIGFSGVVFAFAGFAVVATPVAAVFAMLGIQALQLLRQAVLDPVAIAQTQPRLFRPSFVDVALHGHLYGFLVGVLLGAVLFRYRNRWPNLKYVWFATLVFAITRSMHAIYWYLGGDAYIYFRALGTGGVFILASLVALAVLSREDLLISSIDLYYKEMAVGIMLAIVLALSLVAIPYNLAAVSPGEKIDSGIEVRDYTVTYAENVEDRYISAVQIPVVRDSVSVNVSGVIVASDRRNIWELTTSRNQLAFNGETTVAVGDTTWRETVVVNRTSWQFLDGNRTYTVFGRHDDRPRRVLFEAPPANSSVIMNASRISIQPSDGRYELVVRQNESVVGIEQIPRGNGTVTTGDITFERVENTLFARYQATEIQLAEYRQRRRN